jgi:hypothetical protein
MASADAYSWRKDYQLLGAGLAVIFLLAAAIDDDQSRGYYTFLRIYVTIVALATAWRAHRSGGTITALVAGSVAILFNPFIQVELEQDTWQLLDLLTAAWLSWVALERLAADRQRPWLRYAPVGGAAGLLLLVLGGAYLAERSYSSSPGEDTSAPAPAEVAGNENPFNDLIPARTPEMRLADAFEAATGRRSRYSETVSGEVIVTKPLRIVELPFGPALLTERVIEDGCHACVGAIGVYYLKEEDQQTNVTGSWPKAVEGWGWGAAPTEWSISNAFTKYPAIYATGGYMGQGILMESATLTELTPGGPVTSDLIGTGFSDEGAVVDESRAACVVEGKIANIRKDQSFEVMVKGSRTRTDRYVKRNGKFVALGKREDWEVPCPTDYEPPQSAEADSSTE